MAHVLRLILCGVLVAFAAASHALIPARPNYGISDDTYRDAVGWHGSKGAACSALAAEVNRRVAATSPGVVYGSNAQSDFCYLTRDGDMFNLRFYYRESGAVCPDNSNSAGGGQCQCATNYVEKDGQCVKKPLECPEGTEQQGPDCVPKKCPPDTERDPVTQLCVKPPECPNPGEVRVNGKCEKTKCPKSGASAGDGWGMSGESDEYICEPQGWGTSGSGGSGGSGALYCMIRVRNNFDFTGANGEKLYFGSGKYTGAECQPSSGGGGTKPGDGGNNNGGENPGNGNNNGGNNNGPGNGTGGNGPGNSTGGGGGGGGGSGPKPTKPDPNNPPPKPPSEPTDNEGKCPPGYTKKNGNCYPPTPPPKEPDNDGKCPAGTVKIGSKCVFPSPSGPDDKDGGDGNTTGPGGGGGGGGGDKGNGEFGGSCKAGFGCKGDAIQCAMAREQFIRNCQAFDNPSPESQLYEKSKGKEGDVTKDLPGNSSVDVGSSLSRDSLIGGGSCMPDLTLTVMAQAVHVPFSQYCDYFRYMGYILVAFSLLVAVRIVGSGG